MSIINPIQCWDGNSYTNLDAKNIAFTSSLTGITLNNTGGGPSLQDALIQINDNKVSKTGDIMTGSLNIEMSGNAGKLRTIDPAITLGTNPSAQVTSGGVAMIDSNGFTYGNMYTYHETNGRTNLVFSISNKSSPTASLNTSNNLMLRQKPDGTNEVYVRDPAAWRSAIGVEHIDTAEASATNRYTRYMKFEDGSLICMVEITWTGKITTAYGSMFYNDSAISCGNWPVAFTGVPYMSITCSRGIMALAGPLSGTSKTEVGTLYIYRPSSNATSTTYCIDIIAYGKWK